MHATPSASNELHKVTPKKARHMLRVGFGESSASYLIHLVHPGVMNLFGFRAEPAHSNYMSCSPFESRYEKVGCIRNTLAFLLRLGISGLDASRSVVSCAVHLLMGML